MSGPREELLATGSLGEHGVRLLYRTVRQVVRLRNLPPPPGTTAWTADSLDEAAHEVLATRTGVARLVTLAARSVDEDSFRRQLWQLVANDLTTAGRRTERGRLAERVRDVLPHVAGLGQADERLYLIGTDLDSCGGETPRYDELIAAAASVPVVTPTWNPLSTHSPPVANRDSLVAMIRAVLSRAHEGLSFAGLVDLLAARLGVHDAPVSAEHDLLDALAPAAADDPAGTSAARDAARQLLERLTTAQQLVLPYLDETVTVAAEHTGLGRTKAWQTLGATRLRVAELLSGDLAPEATLREAIAMARARWRLR